MHFFCLFFLEHESDDGSQFNIDSDDSQNSGKLARAPPLPKYNQIRKGATVSARGNRGTTRSDYAPNPFTMFNNEGTDDITKKMTRLNLFEKRDKQAKELRPLDASFKDKLHESLVASSGRFLLNF